MGTAANGAWVLLGTFIRSQWEEIPKRENQPKTPESRSLLAGWGESLSIWRITPLCRPFITADLLNSTVGWECQGLYPVGRQKSPEVPQRAVFSDVATPLSEKLTYLEYKLIINYLGTPCPQHQPETQAGTVGGRGRCPSLPRRRSSCFSASAWQQAKHHPPGDSAILLSPFRWNEELIRVNCMALNIRDYVLGSLLRCLHNLRVGGSL